MNDKDEARGTPDQGAGPYSIGSTTWPGLSKLIEECGEVMQVAGKIIGSGGDSNHWDGTDLTSRLSDELGDLLAAIQYVRAHNILHRQTIEARRDAKFVLFQEWDGAARCEGLDGERRPSLPGRRNTSHPPRGSA